MILRMFRGRPRKTWMEGVRAAMKTRHLEAGQWLNRKKWCLGSGRRRQLSQDRKDRMHFRFKRTEAMFTHLDTASCIFWKCCQHMLG
jgi:hypothetical protein